MAILLSALSSMCWVRVLNLILTGITIDVEVLDHMKLTKYTFSLLQQESINVFYLEEEQLLVHVLALCS